MLGSVPTVNELNLHGPEVNFTFRIEKLAASLRANVLITGAANAELGMHTRFQAKAPLGGFQGSFSFYVPV